MSAITHLIEKGERGKGSEDGGSILQFSKNECITEGSLVVGEQKPLDLT